MTWLQESDGITVSTFYLVSVQIKQDGIKALTDPRVPVSRLPSQPAVSVGGTDDVQVAPLEWTKVDRLGLRDTRLGSTLDMPDMSSCHSQQRQEGQKTHSGARKDQEGEEWWEGRSQ